MRGSPTTAAMAAALLLLLPLGPALAAPGDFGWNRGWDATGFADTDSNGATAAAGMFFGAINLGGGNQFSANPFSGDVWVARYSPTGAFLWSRTFTPNQMGVTVTAVTCAPNGSVYVAGTLIGGAMIDFGGGALSGNDNMWIVKFDDLGNHLWSATFGEGTIHSLDGDQNWLAIGGDLFGSIDFGGGAIVTAGGLDAFVALLHGGAAHVWSKGFGDGNDQSTKDVDVDADGHLVATGCFQGLIDFGSGGMFSNPAPDLFVAPFDTTGGNAWSKNFPGDFGAVADVKVSVAQNSVSDRIALVATSDNAAVDFGGGPLFPLGGTDVVVADFDAAGNWQWSDRYGSPMNDEGQDVAFDVGDNILATGIFRVAIGFGGGVLNAAGGADLFVASWGPYGTFAWNRRFGTVNDDLLCRNVTDPLGNVLLFGSADNGVNFGGGMLPDAGVYLVKLRALSAASDAPVVAGTLDGRAVCAPNPFVDAASLRFDVPRPQTVTATVHDVTGRRIRQLASGSRAAGAAVLEWDGRDDAGRQVPAGMYYWSVRGSEGMALSGRMARVR